MTFGLKDVRMNMTKVFSILALFCCIICSQTTLAQDRVVVEKNGSSFFVHIVEQGQTLYAISKLYQVDVEAIQASNPEVKSGLQIGQTLNIPVPGSYDVKEWTNPIRIENGFYIHRIKRKETLYGISKQYNTDINEILELNGGIELGLQPATEIRLPIRDVEEAATELVEPGPMDGWQTHTVRKGETLYGISKFFDVTPESITDLNGGLKEGLKTDQVILLPIRDELFSKQTEPIDLTVDIKDTLFLKTNYNVVLMLPLYLDQPINKEMNTSTKIDRLRQISMEYYYGTMAALDSLKKQGAHLNVTVLDVHSGTGIETMLQDPAVKSAHLIIGPFQRDPLEKVANYAGRRGIHVVCPVPQSNKVLLRSPNLSKVYPSNDSEIKNMANHVAAKHSGENVILIDSKNIKDARGVQLFKKYYRHALGMANDTLPTPLKTVESSTKFVGELNKQLSKVRRNILVVPAGKQSRSMIANLQTKIQLLDEEEYEVIVFAYDEWLEYDFLDISFKEQIQLSFATSHFIDYDANNVQSFITSYHYEYKQEPSKYSFIGFDVMQYYGSGLIQFGINFPNNFDAVDQSNLLQISFDYTKTGLDSGFENNHVFMLRQRDIQLESLRESNTAISN